jgi:hypothetical protein
MHITGNWDVVTKRYRPARSIHTWEELDAEIYYAKVQVAWQTCPRRVDGFPDMRYNVNKRFYQDGLGPRLNISQELSICYPAKKGVYK